jgi:hypothetical protein
MFASSISRSKRSSVASLELGGLLRRRWRNEVNSAIIGKVSQSKINSPQPPDHYIAVQESKFDLFAIPAAVGNILRGHATSRATKMLDHIVGDCRKLAGRPSSTCCRTLARSSPSPRSEAVRQPDHRSRADARRRVERRRAESYRASRRSPPGNQISTYSDPLADVYLRRSSRPYCLRSLASKAIAAAAANFPELPKPDARSVDWPSATSGPPAAISRSSNSTALVGEQ